MEDVNIINEEKTFLKRLLNWKYMAILIPIQSSLVYLFLNSPNGTFPVFLILGVIFYLSKKTSTNSEKVLSASLQWASFFLYLFITVGIGVIMYYVTTNKGMPKHELVEKVVDTVVQKNKTKLPLIISEDLVLFKIEKVDSRTLMYHIKYTKYTKSEMLASYDNDMERYTQAALTRELRSSCPATGMRDMLKLGVITYATYYGRMNQSIGQIRIDHEQCKPYYLNK